MQVAVHHDGLVEAGFEKQEAADLVVDPTLPLPETAPPALPSEPVTVTLPSAPDGALPLWVVDAVTWEPATKMLRIERPLDDEQETALVAVFSEEKTKAIVVDAIRRRAGRPATAVARPLSPSQRGVGFEVPVRALKQGDFFRQFEADDLDEHFAWSLSESDAELTAFLVPTEQRGIKIDISDSERLQQDFIPVNDAQQRRLFLRDAQKPKRAWEGFCYGKTGLSTTRLSFCAAPTSLG